MSEVGRESRPEEWVIWHDLECGAYAADLPLWSTLAAEAGGPVLDLGCGTGRVSLPLSTAGIDVVGVDREAVFVAELNARAARDGLAVTARVGDVRDLELGGSFALAVAPMQLLQILGGEEERRACLESISRHLGRDGRAAFAVVEDFDAAHEGPPPLPDVLEVDGWVYSSLPVSVRPAWEGIIITRLRQIVSPQGEMTEEQDEVHLSDLPAERLEEEAEAAGLRPAARLQIDQTDTHVGSTVVVVEA
jgi:SAM-dependent methyltransferase